MKPVEERFWSHVDKGDCWLWTGVLRNGYGRFKVDGRKVSAHRWAYEHEVGPIPEGLDLDHLCRNRACVNPAHLEPVTRQINTLRGDTLAARQILRTHCPHGHPYAGDNLYVWHRRRFCRACNRGRKRQDATACAVCADRAKAA